MTTRPIRLMQRVNGELRELRTYQTLEAARETMAELNRKELKRVERIHEEAEQRPSFEAIQSVYSKHSILY